jgi:hypothetical protein
MTSRSGHPRFTNWLAGLVTGSSSGFLLLIVPTLGLLLIALGAIGVVRARPRVAGVSGLLVGIGAIVAVLLIRAQLACEAFNATPTLGCEAPDITPYLALAGGLLAAGVVLSAVAIVDARHPI